MYFKAFQERATLLGHIHDSWMLTPVRPMDTQQKGSCKEDRSVATRTATKGSWSDGSRAAARLGGQNLPANTPLTATPPKLGPQGDGPKQCNISWMVSAKVGRGSGVAASDTRGEASFEHTATCSPSTIGTALRSSWIREAYSSEVVSTYKLW